MYTCTPGINTNSLSVEGQIETQKIGVAPRNRREIHFKEEKN
jgi:hypothetical protein